MSSLLRNDDSVRDKSLRANLECDNRKHARAREFAELARTFLEESLGDDDDGPFQTVDS